MSDQGEEGQAPEIPGLEGKGELPPRPTVRESFRRGLFVRLPTEDETSEGLFEPEQETPEQPAEDASYPDQTRVELYPEQVADPYPGWRQAADGSWEAVSPEASSYAEGYEPAASETYPEIDQSADSTSVAAGEPTTGEETGPEAASPFTFHQPAAETAAGASAGSEEAPLAAMSPPPEAAPEVTPTPEYAPAAEVVPEVASEAAPLVPVTPQPLEAAAEVTAPVAAEFAPEVAPEVATPVAEMPPMPEAAAEVAAPGAELVPEATPATEDPVAGADLYIPSDVELLEGDMPLYSDKDKVPPRFAGQGLGEPIFVEFENLPHTLVGLRRLLPKGTRLTYNFDHERAWIRSSADVDLPSFAERVEEPAAEGEEAPA